MLSSAKSCRTLQLISLVVVLLLIGGSSQRSNMGPYDMVVEQLSNCGSKDRALAFEIHPYFVKVDNGRRQLFKGNIYFPFTKEEFYALTVNNTFYMKKNNDFLLMYKYTDNLCSTVSAYGKDMFNDFLEIIGAEKDDECAIKPGNYSIADWNPLPKLPAPMLEYGTYRVVMKGLLNDQEVTCLEAVGVVQPKSYI